MAACSSSAAASSSCSIPPSVLFQEKSLTLTGPCSDKLIKFPLEIWDKIISSGLSQRDVTRLAVTCKDLYWRLECSRLRALAHHDYGFPEISPKIRAYEEYEETLELRACGELVLDIEKSRELEGATLLGKASGWLMYQHRDGRLLRMNLHDGTIKELWDELKGIFDSDDDVEAISRKWKYDSTLGRLLVAHDCTFGFNVNLSVSAGPPATDYYKFVALDPSIDLDMIKEIIEKQIRSTDRAHVFLLGAWEGEEGTFIVATTHTPSYCSDNYYLKLEVYDIDTGDHLYGYEKLTHERLYTVDYGPVLFNNERFAFNPKNNRFTLSSRSNSMGNHTYDDECITTVSLPRNKFAFYEKMIPVDRYKTTVQQIISKGSSTFVVTHDNCYNKSVGYISETSPSTISWKQKIEGTKGRQITTIALIGQCFLTIAGSGKTVVIDEKKEVKPVKFLPSFNPSSVFVGGRMAVVENISRIRSSDDWFSCETHSGTKDICAYVWKHIDKEEVV